MQKDLKLKGDYGRLRQMFMIIVDNAIKFSPKNGVINIEAKDNTISIHDSGKGIDEELWPYIFDRFTKIQNKENKTGLGLGLTIAKQIAKRHNLSLIAENHPGGGAVFICEL